MIVDLVDKFLNYLITFSNSKRTKSEKQFEDNIELLISLFEDIHKGYIDTFKKCRDYISNNDDPFKDVNKIVDIIHVDSLFTYDQRLKLISFSLNLNNCSIKNHELSIFLKSLEDYLEIPFAYVFNESIENAKLKSSRDISFICMPNVTRLNIQEKIIWANSLYVDVEEKKKKVIEILDYLLNDLQEKYGKVIFEYSKLKTI